MKAMIIADDFTGANDAGVQFAKKQLSTTVLMQEKAKITDNTDVLVIDTDSRSSLSTTAYEKVKSAIKLANQYEIDCIYKKIDSTMRGNIGAELDALLDHSDAKLIMITPSYPSNNRYVENGCMFVDDVLLEETYFARDISTPIHSSSIKSIIAESSRRSTDIITLKDFHQNRDSFLEKITSLRSNGVEYIVCDAKSNNHLRELFTYMKQYEEPFIWCGSAGMAEQLAVHLASQKKYEVTNVNNNNNRILFAVGSVHECTRKQLAHLLAHSNIKGIEIDTPSLLDSKERRQEILKQTYNKAVQSLQDNENIVLYTSATQEAIKLSRKNGERHELSPVEVSTYISSSIGELVRLILEEVPIGKALFTGGDTAKKVAEHIQSNQFHLLDEVENGIPIGMLTGKYNLLTVTKAGGFGKKDSLLKSYYALGGA